MEHYDVLTTLKGYQLNHLSAALDKTLKEARVAENEGDPRPTAVAEVAAKVARYLYQGITGDEDLTVFWSLSGYQFDVLQVTLNKEILDAQAEGRTGTPYPTALSEVLWILQGIRAEIDGIR